MRALQVGPAIVYPLERRLFVAGAERRIGGRAFDLLLAFLHEPGRLFGRDELYETVWADAAVEPNNLAVQLLALRRLLGQDAIVTVPRRGYRLVAPVRPLDGPPGLLEAPQGDQPPLEALVSWVAGRLVHERWVTLAGPDPEVARVVAAAACQAHCRAHGRVLWHLDDRRPQALEDPVLQRRLARTGALVLVCTAGATARLAIEGWIGAQPATGPLRVLATVQGTCAALAREHVLQLPPASLPAGTVAPEPSMHVMRWRKAK